MEVRELVTKLGFNFDPTGPKQYEGAIGKIISLSTVLKAALASAAVVGIGKLISSTVHFGEEINDAAIVTGIAVENLTKLRFTAKLAGVETESLTGALGIFSTQLSEAQEGSKEAVKNFAELGIKPSQLTDTNTAFNLVAQKLARMEDGFEKVALARKLFGRSGAQLLPAFNPDERIQRYLNVLGVTGFKVTKEFAAQSDRISDSMAVLGMFVTYAKNRIGQGLLPVMEKSIDKMFDWIEANKEWIGQGIESAIKVLTVAFNAMAFVVEKVGKAVSFLSKNFAFLTKTTAGKALVGTLAFFLTMNLWLPKVIAGVRLLVLAIAGLNWPLMAVYAIIGGLILIVDDFRAALNGGKSLFAGKVIESFKKLKAWLEAWWPEFKDDLKNFFHEAFNGAKQALDAFVDYFKSKIQSLIDFMPDWIIKIGSEAWNAPENVTKKSTTPGDAISKINPFFNPAAFNPVPPTSQIIRPGDVQTNNDISMNQTINVNVENNGQPLDEKTLGEQIKKKTAEVIQNQLRTAFRNVQGIERRTA